MTTVTLQTAAVSAAPPRVSHARWAMLPIAALAMVSTFPGRTFGIGLITEPLLADLHLGRVEYARINLWATLIGAAFCLPAGKANDAWGLRATLTLTAAALGATLLYLGWSVHGALSLLAALILLRGFGQSALSIVSLAMLGKWFTRQLALANGLFAVLISVGFAAMFGLVGAAVERLGWRAAWSGMGWFALLGLASLAALAVRSPPLDTSVDDLHLASDYTLAQAAKTARFWLYGLSSALFALLSSALLLFQESILQSLGFGHDVYIKTQIASLLFGLCFNFLGGWLGSKIPLTRLLASGWRHLLSPSVFCRWRRNLGTLIFTVRPWGPPAALSPSCFLPSGRMNLVASMSAIFKAPRNFSPFWRLLQGRCFWRNVRT